MHVAYTTLVDVEMLAQHLDDPNWVVVDCRHALKNYFALGRRLYDDAHIPGAFFSDVEHDLAGPHTGSNGRHPLPDPMSSLRICAASASTTARKSSPMTRVVTSLRRDCGFCVVGSDTMRARHSTVATPCGLPAAIR